MSERRLPPALRDEPFSVAQAISRGVGRHRLRRADLVAPFHGVRAETVPTTVLQRARCLTRALHPRQAFSHTTAATVWGVPLPLIHEHALELHVTTFDDDRAMRRLGVVGHRCIGWTPSSIEAIHGVPVTAPELTWIALGSLLALDDLVVAGDALVGPLRLTTIDRLERALSGHRGRRGVRRLDEAIGLLRRGSRSPGETRLRLVCHRAGLPEPELNVDVRHDGRFIACVDLAWPRERVAVEYEGDHHRTDRTVFRSDITRGERLRAAGWEMLRTTADDLHGREFVRRLRVALSRERA